MTQPAPPVDLGRFNSLADGIFAVAMTFLAVSIHLPAPAPAGAAPQAGLAFQLANLAVAFYVIGRYWMAHNRRHRLIILGTETLVSLELLMLFGIVLIPVTLSLYDQIPATFEGVTLYASSYILVSLTDTAILAYARQRPHCLHAHTTSGAISAAITLTLLPVVVFTASILIALWDPRFAPLSWWLMFAMPALSRRILARHESPATHTSTDAP